MCQATEEKPGSKMKKAGPLAWIWTLFGFVHVTLLLLAMFFSTNVLPTISYFFFAPLSSLVHQRIVTYMGAMAHAGILFWCEYVGGLKPKFYGDIDLLRTKYTSSKLVVANHQSFTDSVLLYGLAWRLGEIGHMRAFAKKTLKSWPILGGLWSYLNFIFLSRNFNDDAPKIKKQLNMLVEKSQFYSTGNFWLMIYPEGTRSRPNKIKEGQEYSKSKNLPVYNHLLVPRVKGLQVTIPSIHEAIDGVVDVTIGYKERRPKDGKVIPSVEGLLFGGWRSYEVHAHVRVIPASEVPTDEDKIHDWIMKVFEEKDKLLAEFEKTGSFPSPAGADSKLAGPGLLQTMGNLTLFFAAASATAAGMVYAVLAAYAATAQAMAA